MYAKATTTISILRGSQTADRYGDVEPSDAVQYSGIPASIMDQRVMVQTPDSPTPKIMTVTKGRVGSNADVRYGDTIKDEITGTLYQITNVGKNRNPARTPDTILDLSRVSNYGS